MAASAADVRSILAIPGPSTSSGTQPKKTAGPSTRKPEGISRELYSLIGPSAPSLAAQLAKPRLKQKPNLGGGGRVKWECRSFKNGARSDSLELKHWVKSRTDPDSDYGFTKYNIQTSTYTYSHDEYARLLEDPNWSKEETDYLFQVCQDYDLRWYVIHDRYSFPDGPPRALEDVKDRYYSVCRKLVRVRPWAGDEASKIALLSSLTFDKEKELIRKKYIRSLDNRTPEQIAEEEALFIELKRLEQTERKFKREREDLLRTLAGIDSGLPDIADEEGPFGLTIDTKTKKKRDRAMDVDTPSTPATVSAPIVKRPPQTAKSAAYDAQHCIIRTDLPPTTPATKAAHTPAYLRSYKLPIPKATIAPKVTQTLAELGISHSRLVMPTKDNSAILESLLDATMSLVEMKKLVDKVEYDINVAKTRLGMRGSEGAEAGGEGGGDSKSDAMEVDDQTQDGGEDGRAQSVLSTRSTKSRKQSRRSMSISSVDTSATVSTRAGTKRQKRN